MYIVTFFFPSSYTLEKVQNAVMVFLSVFFISFFLPSLLRPGIEEAAAGE